jgi:hypothetical protein
MADDCATVTLLENIARLKKLRTDYQDLLQRNACLNYPRFLDKRKEIHFELKQAKKLETENYELLQKIRKTF